MCPHWLVAAAEGGSASAGPWVTATVGFLGVIAGSVIAALFTARRERAARREESQRAALYELQDAALTLQRALVVYGRAQEAYEEAGHEVDEEVVTRLDDATGRLQVLTQRILSATVRRRIHTWQELAQAFHTGDETVTVAQTDAAWVALHEDIGARLRDLT